MKLTRPLIGILAAAHAQAQRSREQVATYDANNAASLFCTALGQLKVPISDQGQCIASVELCTHSQQQQHLGKQLNSTIFLDCLDDQLKPAGKTKQSKKATQQDKASDQAARQEQTIFEDKTPSQRERLLLNGLLNVHNAPIYPADSVAPYPYRCPGRLCPETGLSRPLATTFGAQSSGDLGFASVAHDEPQRQMNNAQGRSRGVEFKQDKTHKFQDDATQSNGKMERPAQQTNTPYEGHGEQHYPPEIGWRDWVKPTGPRGSTTRVNDQVDQGREQGENVSKQRVGGASDTPRIEAHHGKTIPYGSQGSDTNIRRYRLGEPNVPGQDRSLVDRNLGGFRAPRGRGVGEMTRTGGTRRPRDIKDGQDVHNEVAVEKSRRDH